MNEWELTCDLIAGKEKMQTKEQGRAAGIVFLFRSEIPSCMK